MHADRTSSGDGAPVFLVVLFGILVLLETLSLPGQFLRNATTLRTDLEAAI